MFKTLEDGMLVAGQIDPEDVAEAARLGVRLIVNNRPDDEQPGQPSGAEIAAAAASAGIAYRAIPVDHSGYRPEQWAAMATALAEADGPVLAFCRSGTRSTFLWALARKAGGAEGERLIGQARAAGYDLGPIAGHLRA
jgi:uncharacterized protein (TIGR01244 family)